MSRCCDFICDAAGRRSSLGFGAGDVTSTLAYGYDPINRLSSLTRDLAGTDRDQSLGFTYNTASQVVARTSSNDAYASTSAYDVSRGYSVNGLNQYTAAGTATFAYDANGNLTSDGSTSFVYDAENRLVSASGARNATLSYDPLGRLWQVSGQSGTTRFLYDGDDLLQEFDGAGNLLRAWVHGPGADEPLIWYEYTAGFSRRYLHADHQGSIVAATDAAGTAIAVAGYDAWGIPNAGSLGVQPGGVGRFGYTGQAWLPELGMYHYKARVYSPTLGRFLQTDPIGYDDQINLYAYVANDPVNNTDPDGRCTAGALTAGGISSALDGPAPFGEAVAGVIITGSCIHRAYRAIASFMSGGERNAEGVVTHPDGKTHGDLPAAQDIPRDEIDSSIAALSRSIERRSRENERFPRGNPNGNRNERRQFERHIQHRQQIAKEQRLREQLIRRREEIRRQEMRRR